MSPLDYPPLGIKWDNQYYFDRCLAMGLKSSCAIFEKFSTSLEWLAVHHLEVSAVLHTLDDFLFIAHSHGKCQADLCNFLSMCDFLGVPIAHEKTLGPLTSLQFAEIELDSVRPSGVRTGIAMHCGCRSFKMAAKVEKFPRLYALYFDRHSSFLRKLSTVT